MVLPTRPITIHFEMVPSSEFQLQFLQKVQLLLDSGKFTSTYKFALLIALTNIAVEKGDDSGAALEVNLDDVAREFLSLYWSQARPYGKAPLMQNAEREHQARIITLLIPELGASQSAHLRLRQYEQQRDGLLNATRRLIVKFPLKHLQHFESVDDQKYSKDQFLYKFEGADASNLQLQTITLKPGVAACLRSLRGVIVALVQARWARWVREKNPSLGKDRNLEAFMFGQDRQPLTHLAPRLYEMQNGRCFYTDKKLDAPKAGEVDHFIAWAKYACNDPMNLVLASRKANNDKSDHIASTRHLKEWVKRNAISSCDSSKNPDPQSVLSIARWAYAHAASMNTPAWDAPKKLVKLDGSWAKLCAG